VLGDTSRSRRRPAGSSLLSALRTVRSTQVRVGRWFLTTLYGNLVAERQDLDILGCIGAGEQCQPAEYA
jgi:hypothetical protein